LPETKGRSLEEMDIIFGAVDANARRAEIEKEERAINKDYKPHGEVDSVRSDGDVKV
jgi:hypothetical protein